MVETTFFDISVLLSRYSNSLVDMYRWSSGVSYTNIDQNINHMQPEIPKNKELLMKATGAQFEDFCVVGEKLSLGRGIYFFILF